MSIGGPTDGKVKDTPYPKMKLRLRLNITALMKLVTINHFH